MCRDSLLDWQRAQTGLDSNRRTETPHAGHLCVCRASESFTRPGPLPFRRGAVSGRGGARAGVHLRSVVPGSPSPGNALSRQRPPTIRHRAIHMGPGLPCQGGGLKLADNGDRRPRAGLALRRCRNVRRRWRGVGLARMAGRLFTHGRCRHLDSFSAWTLTKRPRCKMG